MDNPVIKPRSDLILEFLEKKGADGATCTDIVHFLPNVKAGREVTSFLTRLIEKKLIFRIKDYGLERSAWRYFLIEHKDSVNMPIDTYKKKAKAAKISLIVETKYFIEKNNQKVEVSKEQFIQLKELLGDQ